MYTSGTTGRPKGAVLTHRAVLAQLHQALLTFGGAPGERALVVAPLYHAAAAEATLASAARVTAAIERAGAEAIADDPESLPPRIADRYLALKKAGRL